MINGDRGKAIIRSMSVSGSGCQTGHRDIKERQVANVISIGNDAVFEILSTNIQLIEL